MFWCSDWAVLSALGRITIPSTHLPPSLAGLSPSLSPSTPLVDPSNPSPSSHRAGSTTTAVWPRLYRSSIVLRAAAVSPAACCPPCSEMCPSPASTLCSTGGSRVRISAWNVFCVCVCGCGFYRVVLKVISIFNGVGRNE